MNCVKNGLFILLLALILCSSLGHGLIDHFIHVTDLVENTSGSKNSVKTVIYESSMEEDHFFTIPKSTCQPDISFIGKIACQFLLSPVNSKAPVWLPPELS
jgi:hypothetical protein